MFSRYIYFPHDLNCALEWRQTELLCPFFLKNNNQNAKWFWFPLLHDKKKALKYLLYFFFQGQGFTFTISAHWNRIHMKNDKWKEKRKSITKKYHKRNGHLKKKNEICFQFLTSEDNAAFCVCVHMLHYLYWKKRELFF
jgi:hypothetical protein